MAIAVMIILSMNIIGYRYSEDDAKRQAGINRPAFITCTSFKFKSTPLANFSILNYNTRK